MGLEFLSQSSEHPRKPHVGDLKTMSLLYQDEASDALCVRGNSSHFRHLVSGIRWRVQAKKPSHYIFHKTRDADKTRGSGPVSRREAKKNHLRQIILEVLKTSRLRLDTENKQTDTQTNVLIQLYCDRHPDV